jgi:hypothetical protein
VTIKSIPSGDTFEACDICGRTLLRGEQAEVVLNNGVEQLACALCTQRALIGGPGGESGWTPIERPEPARSERTRAFVERLREIWWEVARGPVERAVERYRVERLPRHDDDSLLVEPQQRVAEAGALPAWVSVGGRAEAIHAVAPTRSEPHLTTPVPSPSGASPAPAPEPRAPDSSAPPSPMHRALQVVPSESEVRAARALTVFNASEHTRTVAGVARALGAPLVCVRSSPTEHSLVSIVVGWELGWYRYEVDLADEGPGIRLVDKGMELSELPPYDQSPNAAADESGRLYPEALAA